MARKSLFDSLPLIWRRLDKYNFIENNAGTLERFLSVLDTALDNEYELVDRFIRETKNIEKIEDRFTILLGGLVRHIWRYDQSYAWNRKRITELINRYSNKGTYIFLADLCLEYNITDWNVVDMASTIICPGLQGNLGCWNSYFHGADIHDMGVYKLFISDDCSDWDSFYQDFEENIHHAGTKWIFVFTDPFELGVELVYNQETRAIDYIIDFVNSGLGNEYVGNIWWGEEGNFCVVDSAVWGNPFLISFAAIGCDSNILCSDINLLCDGSYNTMTQIESDSLTGD